MIYSRFVRAILAHWTTGVYASDRHFKCNAAMYSEVVSYSALLTDMQHCSTVHVDWYSST